MVFGTRLLGKVDAVPGLGHVATRFFHVNFLPLIPTQSYLVLARTGKSFRGIPIPLSFKSLVIAWVRTITFAAAIIGGIVLMIGLTGSPSDRAGMFVPGLFVFLLAGGAFVFSITHRSATKASYARAIELGKLLKLNANGMAALAQAYGQAPPSYGFEPLPMQKRPTAVLPMPVEPLADVELIDADGEDGEPDNGQYAVGQYTDAVPVEPIDEPAPIRTVQPIRPKSGY
jgi:hypothetical protein